MPVASRATLRRLVRARDLIHADAQRGPTLEDLAAASGLSRAFLARSFAQTFGVPPHRYLVELRLEHAKRALARGTSVTEACLEVGFASLGSFSASFHRRVGVSPREWQRRTRALVQGLGMPALFIPSCYLDCHLGRVDRRSQIAGGGAPVGSIANPTSPGATAGTFEEAGGRWLR